MRTTTTAVALVGLASTAHGLCPHLASLRASGEAPPSPRWKGMDAAAHARLAAEGAALRSSSVDESAYAAALATLDWRAVKTDLLTLFKTSDPRWPADYGNYGPLFVRLAWHTSGSYRLSDGRGGAGGGRQRFEPERSWADNTNLDKARSLLGPIKEKYGIGLSWGDLFIFAGTVAIESMGGPVLGFCGGRIDAVDGDTESVALGPSPEQMRNFPCGENNANNGTCTAVSGLGANTVGLIYLNPEGPGGVPLVNQTAPTIRDTFGRMAMNDTETVALIGGGHAFGKTHGACPTGPGPSPREDPLRPWPGTCESNSAVQGGAKSKPGVGANSFTSGFEGPWTTTPTKWDNQYFQNLDKHSWEVHTGAGGHNQWRVAGGKTPTTAGPQGGEQPIMMMTSDVSLTYDPAYKNIVHAWARDTAPFDNAFKHAWYKLTTRDHGPRARCVEATGVFPIPEPQPWQHPLPMAAQKLAKFEQVAPAVRALITQAASASAPVAPDTMPDGSTSYAAHFMRLAYHCAATFRSTDYQGGCNGARLRFSPQKDWAANQGLDATLTLLKPIKDLADAGHFGGALSWADLIVLAGNVALESVGGYDMTFCGGRVDDPDGADTTASSVLEPRQFGPDAPGKLAYPETPTQLMYLAERLRLSKHELVVLVGGLHSIGTMKSGVNDPTLIAGKATRPDANVWTASPGALSNAYFKTLLNNEWTCASWPEGLTPASGEYWNCNFFVPADPIAVGKDYHVSMLPTDLLIKNTPGLAATATMLAESDPTVFVMEFAAVWTKVMNNDRFDGPTGSVCASDATLTAKLVPMSFKCQRGQCIEATDGKGLPAEACAAFCVPNANTRGGTKAMLE